MNNDGKIVAYLAKVVRHEYIRLSKKNCKILYNEAPFMEDMIVAEAPFEEKIELKVSLKIALDSLTPLQRTVIEKVILEDRTEAEVAKELNISRQAVNKAKQRALLQLREQFVERTYG